MRKKDGWWFVCSAKNNWSWWYWAGPACRTPCTCHAGDENKCCKSDLKLINHYLSQVYLSVYFAPLIQHTVSRHVRRHTPERADVSLHYVGYASLFHPILKLEKTRQKKNRRLLLLLMQIYVVVAQPAAAPRFFASHYCDVLKQTPSKRTKQIRNSTRGAALTVIVLPKKMHHLGQHDKQRLTSAAARPPVAA